MRNPRMILLIAALFWTLPSTAITQQPFSKPVFYDLRKEAHSSAKSGRTLMIIVEKNDCSLCPRMLASLSAPNVTNLIKQKFDAVQIDADSNSKIIAFDGTELSQKEWVENLRNDFAPMVYFFGARGDELFRMPGYYDPDLFVVALNYVVNREYETGSFRAYAKSLGHQPFQRSALFPTLFQTLGDLNALREQNATEGKGLALYFAKPDCENCFELEQKVFSNSTVSGELEKVFTFTRVDAESTEPVIDFAGERVSGSALAAAYGIGFTPSLLFFDTKGQEIGRLDHYLRPTLVLSYLAEILKGRTARKVEPSPVAMLYPDRRAMRRSVNNVPSRFPVREALGNPPFLAEFRSRLVIPRF